MTLRKFYLLGLLLTAMLPATVIGQCVPIVFNQATAFNCDNGNSASARLEFQGTPPFSIDITKAGSSVTNNYVSTTAGIWIDNLEPNVTYNVVATNPCGSVTTSLATVDYPNFVPSNTAQPCIDGAYTVCFPHPFGATNNWTNNGNPVYKMDDCFIVQNYFTGLDGNYHINSNYRSGCVVRDYDMTIAGVDCSTLPVQLVNFRVSNEQSTNRMTWSTTEEINSEKFDLERSTDVKNWTKIGEVAAGGDSHNTLSYEFADQMYESGTNYYRLKMIDLDGTYAYSKVISITNVDGTMTILPNPSISKIEIRAGFEVKEVTIFNMNGEPVLSSQLSATSRVIDVSRLPKGLYMLKITASNRQMFSKKLVIGE